MSDQSKHWYRARAADYICNKHPKSSNDLVRALAAHTGMSETNTRHLLDRLRHLCTCCREQEAITLLRLMPGTKQVRKPSEFELKAMDEGGPEPDWLRAQRRAGLS